MMWPETVQSLYTRPKKNVLAKLNTRRNKARQTCSKLTEFYKKTELYNQKKTSKIEGTRDKEGKIVHDPTEIRNNWRVFERNPEPK